MVGWPSLAYGGSLENCSVPLKGHRGFESLSNRQFNSSNIFIRVYSNSFICMFMKNEILKLRSEGKSYNEIKSILGCSKGTIAYHCGDGQKDKCKLRVKNYKKTLTGILKRKKDNFSFVNGNRRCLQKRKSLNFSSNEFKDKLINNPICYLSGRKIDLLQPKTYQCDHIIPVSRGGGCSFDNLGLTCKEVNFAKGDMILEDFIQLCKEILIHQGFKVEKNLDITKDV